ncbi:MAG: response regulator, partial [Flavobacteriaceae bacterium]|nr:response regulator [Flavobacteriaceae bacterium]
EAELYCNKAVELFKTIGDESYLSSVYNNIGNVFTKSNLHEKALEYYNLSHELSIKSQDARNISLTALNIAEKNEQLGNYKIAAEYYRVYGDSTQAHYKRLVDTKFTEAEAKYQTEQKDKEIAQQELEIAQQKNNRNNWIIGSLLFIAIAIALFQWRINKQKRKKLLAESNYKNEQEINELRTKFLGNIAHEIRTPLTLISGNLDLALENYDQKDKAVQNIKTALSNSKKVVEDANEILELLKFEKNKTTIKLSPVNLNETLKRIFYAFNSLAEIKHLDLKYHSNISENYSTKLDIEKVEKILNNLISNAIKYSPANSKINFNAELIEEELVVKVTDYGQGIHFNETEKIFQRFYQSSQSNAVGGIGIGLSLAKEFSELLNGSLTVESELKKGSTFIFTLPVSRIDTIETSEQKDSKTEIISEEPQEEINLATTQKPKILIVEDNPEMCNYMVEILSQSYDCSTAFDGEEALVKIKENTYDLITSDIMMPKMDGFQLREKLNENAKYKYIPFILISAKTLEEDKVKGFNLGINDYIVKPFNKAELIARIKNLLINKKSREKWVLQQEDFNVDATSSEEKLLKKIEQTVIKNLSDENFKISDLAKNVGYSQRQLTRILKQYTGMSPVKFILEIRLQKAYQLLQNKTFYTLSEVRYDVGITSSPYFNKKFKERFGLNPSELLS